METRKIQKTGGSTYIISLPKQWMVENNLKNGNVVAMEVDENSLRIWNPNVELSEKKGIPEH
jgi:SpoVT / AbrB like domain.